MSYSMLSDQELTALLNEGDQLAFTEIYRKYWEKIYISAYRRLKDKEQCRDIVQNVFAALWERRAEVVIKGLSAYLHTAIRFQVIKYVTRKPQNSELTESFENLISSPIQTDNQLFEKEVIKLLNLYIAALPKKRKEIFLLYHVEGISTSQIAEKLGISQKTVQNQINTVNQALRVRLQNLLVILIISGFFINRP
ncbi:sigma-70 family RNA polymerase sigma factor [Pedobacter sp. PAMC26386]|nr:sigma-70 family RNA polymerase sigma factor [Pedobacter sp. PAMC26386]